ncbi:hypothetical protein PG991_003745 [Apiospora marii]|uniref:Uncharacterized protein n=1 Tax=Apiospora marii TaxID=335849 RepID=A0ABR1S493_9PEZI
MLDNFLTKAGPTSSIPARSKKKGSGDVNTGAETERNIHGPHHYHPYYSGSRRPSRGEGLPFFTTEGYAHTPEPQLSPSEEEEEEESSWLCVCGVPVLSFDDVVRCVVGAIALVLLGWLWVGSMYPPNAYE